jgi:hypothetical protein
VKTGTIQGLHHFAWRCREAEETEDTAFDFGDILSFLAKTRSLGAGSIEAAMWCASKHSMNLRSVFRAIQQKMA